MKITSSVVTEIINTDEDIEIFQDTIFKKDVKCRNLTGLFNIIVKGDLNCYNLNCLDLDCRDLNCLDLNCFNLNCFNLNCFDLNCYNLNCYNLSYYAVCFAYQNIRCKSITGRRDNHKHFVLDGKIIVGGEEVSA